jgi:hypothetical protein
MTPPSNSRRALKRKLLLALAACAVLAGATTAVVMAAQPATHAGRGSHAHGARSHQAGVLGTAAGYLGVPAAQLRSELASGRSLADIADATPGKSSTGLIAAVESAENAKLAADAAGVPARVTAEVNRVGRSGRPLTAAAGYLDIGVRQLREELRSGHTLAQLAASSPGKSPAGLTEALVAARRSALAAEVSAGDITQAQADAAGSQLARRVSAQITRVRHPHHAHTGTSAP